MFEILVSLPDESRFGIAAERAQYNARRGPAEREIGTEQEYIEHFLRSNAAVWTARALGQTLPVNGVPQEVTRRQARQALILSGKLDLVQPAIDAITDPVQRALMQSEWVDSQTFQRDRPQLIALATALGMTDADVDALFTLAASLA